MNIPFRALLLTTLDPGPLGLCGTVSVPARARGRLCALVAAGDHGQVLQRRPAALRPRRRPRTRQAVVRDDDEVVDLKRSNLNFAPY